jgi:uncharacterized protein
VLNNADGADAPFPGLGRTKGSIVLRSLLFVLCPGVYDESERCLEVRSIAGNEGPCVSAVAAINASIALIGRLAASLRATTFPQPFATMGSIDNTRPSKRSGNSSRNDSSRRFRRLPAAMRSIPWRSSANVTTLMNTRSSSACASQALLAFLRLVTNSRVFEHPESILDAWGQVRTWLACESAWTPEPTERHAELLGEFLALPGVHGNLVPDAHLAALAVEHGLTLCSTDGDFARFRALRWINPIAD